MDLLATEEEIKRNPFSVPLWLSLVQENPSLYSKRAVKALPRSLLLWKYHWEYVLESKSDQEIIACFEHATHTTLSAFPRLWVVYLEYLLENCRNATHLRRSLQRALECLTLPQHEKVWNVVIPRITERKCILPIVSRARILERYCQYNPEFRLDFADWCEQHGRWGQAGAIYLKVLEATDDSTAWDAFGNLCSQHSAELEHVGIEWEAILRTALRQEKERIRKRQEEEQASEETTTTAGTVYPWLATAWVQRGEFDLARSVYEEGLEAVSNVRDFTILFEAYLSLEEGLLQHAVKTMEESDDMEEEETEEEDDMDILLGNTKTSPLADMELALARAEDLTRRRPLMLNAVRLRQDTHNIDHWLERASLQEGLQAKSTLERGLKTVTTKKKGRSKMVLALAKIGSIEEAREVYRRTCVDENGIVINHKDDLTDCWAAWIEMELEQEQWDEALSLARQAVAYRKGRRTNLTKSLRLWDLLLDLEESLGTVQTTKDSYNRAIKIKAATVQHILNFATFLKEHNYFEESFSVYERGVELFGYPHDGATLLWKTYLDNFLERHADQVERLRDLFQRSVKDCPAAQCAMFYTMYGSFEEKNGLTKRALAVYHEMCQKVPVTEKLMAYQLYIVKATKLLGMEATRDVYQEAVEVLNDSSSAKICIEFAEMEGKLKQFERARAIFAYGAQMADPRKIPEFWVAWKDFEISNGNENTFREMLRIKRASEARFQSVNVSAVSQITGALSEEDAMRMIAAQEGVHLDEIPQTGVSGFVAGKRTLGDLEESAAKLRKLDADEIELQDEDEIDIDDIDAEIEAAAQEGATAAVKDVQTKAVPAAVFGSLKDS